MKNLLRRRVAVSHEERASVVLFLMCWIAYMTICMTKFAFSASIAPIVQEGIFTKSQAGLISGAYYLFYGAAQIVFVKFIDRISPNKFIAIAIAGSIACCVGISQTHSFGMILFLWSMCGILQFATWPSTLRIIAEYLLPEHKPRAMKYISFALCAGTLANYLIAAVILKFAGWRMIFIVVSILALCVLIIWIFTSGRCIMRLSAAERVQLPEKGKNSTEPKKGMWKLIMSSGIVLMLIPSFIRSALDTGLKSWVPTMITENYAVSTSFSNVLTMALVFVNLGGVFISSWLYPKRCRNAVGAFAICCLIALPMTVLMLFVGRIPLAVAVLLLAGVTTMMYACYQINYVIIPAEFNYCGKSGGVASILNAGASFGAVAANFGFGFLAEHVGWGGTILSWIIMAFIALVVCTVTSRIWSRFLKNRTY